MTRLLLTLTAMAGILTQAWGQVSSPVRYDNATKAITAPIPFRVGQSAVDPTAPGNGSLWYDTATNTLEARINGATVNLGAAASAPFDDATAIVKGSADPTKLLRFEIDNFTTGTTRTITMPNLVGTNTMPFWQSDNEWSGTNQFTSSVSIDGPGDITFTPSGVGLLTIAPITTAGSINRMNIGGVTPGSGAFTTLSASGQVTSAVGSSAAPGYSWTGDTNTGFISGLGSGGASGSTWHVSDGSIDIAFNASGLVFKSSRILGWAATSVDGAADTLVGRGGAAATVQLGANAATGVNQKLKAMDASAGTGGNLTLAAGTGTTAGGALIFQTAPTGTLQDRLTIPASGAANIVINAGGLDATTGSITIANSGLFTFFGRTRLSSPADNELLLRGSGADFINLHFGGTTSSFPKLKRSTTTLQARLADDSEFAAVQTLYQRFGAGTPEANVAAPVGATYNRTDGGAVTSFYVKESGGTTNTGWVAK